MMAAGVRTEAVEVVVTKRAVATAARAWPQLRGTSPPTLGAATGQTGQAVWAMGHGRESNARAAPVKGQGRVLWWRRTYVPSSAAGRGLRWFSDRILLSALLGSVDLAGGSRDYRRGWVVVEVRAVGGPALLSPGCPVCCTDAAFDGSRCLGGVLGRGFAGRPRQLH
jgi:hypothetical protein